MRSGHEGSDKESVARSVLYILVVLANPAW
jgi:hypothetical protein